jgi:hypothetical protein
MYGDNPPVPTTSDALRFRARSARIQDLLTELDAREALAAAALPTALHHFGWAAFAPDSGLTEAQESFVSYWAPQRVIDECHATRELISAACEWAEAPDENRAQHLVDQLLNV